VNHSGVCVSEKPPSLVTTTETEREETTTIPAAVTEKTTTTREIVTEEMTTTWEIVTEETATMPAEPVAVENLCLDKGYDNPRSREVVQKHGYQGHIASKEKEKKKVELPAVQKQPARRYVVERTIAWLAKCRGLLIRYEYKSENYLAQLEFACALLWYRRLAKAAAESA
jgi:transposase